MLPVNLCKLCDFYFTLYKEMDKTCWISCLGLTAHDTWSKGGEFESCLAGNTPDNYFAATLVRYPRTRGKSKLLIR